MYTFSPWPSSGVCVHVCVGMCMYMYIIYVDLVSFVHSIKVEVEVERFGHAGLLQQKTKRLTRIQVYINERKRKRQEMERKGRK